MTKNFLHFLHTTPKTMRTVSSSIYNLVAYHPVCYFGSFSYHDCHFEITKYTLEYAFYEV